MYQYSNQYYSNPSSIESVHAIISAENVELGTSGQGGIFNNIFMYSGDVRGLQTRLDSVAES